MEPTRRLWGVGVLALGGAILAVLLTEPLFLGVPVGIGVWVLLHQLAFTETLDGVTTTSPVTQSLSRETVLVGNSTLLTIRVNPEVDSFFEFAPKLHIQPPAALEPEGSRDYELTGEQQPFTIPLQVQVAGEYSIEPPKLEVTCRRGLFRETLAVGNGCTVTGEPRVPREIHVGTGGEQIAVAYGEHDASQGGTGFNPGELRKYLPGDPANRIDWKTTARMGEPHVREFDPETTRQTRLIVDRREAMADGQPGETKLDYAREIGVWLTEYVASLDDPLGLTLVSNDQVSNMMAPEASTTQYQQIRRNLLDLTVTQPPQSQSGFNTATVRNQKGWNPRPDPKVAATLETDDAFSRTLRPYFQYDNIQIQSVSEEPLYRAVETLNENRSDNAWLVIITDDTNRSEVLETARAAATREQFVTLFVLPSVLFERPPGTDIEAAYHAYRDFESFRKQLTAHSNVTAFEVGPRDRLEGLLETTHTRRAEQ